MFNDFLHEEFYFVQQTIFQLYIAYEAIQAGYLSNNDGLKRDIQSYFKQPIPLNVWEELKTNQEEGFVYYVEQILSKDKT